MKWYHYIACFLAGVFLVNAAPHFIHGIDGDAFPTPFADPPGKGLSSPLVNVLWALANIVIGYLLARTGRFSINNQRAVVFLFLGIAVLTIMFSIMAPSVLEIYKAAQ
jgi:hypothetical protein